MDVDDAAPRKNILEFVTLQLVVAGAAAHDHRLDICRAPALLDQLQGYKFEDIFPGCRIIDIHDTCSKKTFASKA